MLIIVKEGKLDEKKKLDAYKYKRWFEIIKRVCNLIEEMEQIDEYFAPRDEFDMEKNRPRQIMKILDDIEEQIDYARRHAEGELPIWKTGELPAWETGELGTLETKSKRYNLKGKNKKKK